MTFSERLKKAMEKHGISTAGKLAQLSGISQTMISKILRGDASPTIQTVESICVALGITIEQFFSDSTTEISDAERMKAALIRIGAIKDGVLDEELIDAFVGFLGNGKKLFG